LLQFFFKDLILGVFFIALAFWLGSQESVIWGFAGFLPFFIIGVVVIIHGWNQRVKQNDPS
jgi:hypothetical protein